MRRLRRAVVERSFRKAPLREIAFLHLAEVREAHTGEIAAVLGCSTSRVHRLMNGHLPDYRGDLSLVGLGLACRERTRLGDVYRLTTRGKGWAARLQKERAGSAPRVQA